MNLKERIETLAQLGEYLKSDDDYLDAVIHRTHFNNLWFTPENQKNAIQAIATEFLDPGKLEKWAAQYAITEQKRPVNIGMVMAGNIPLAGFHDLVCTFIAGFKSVIKLSEKDKFLLPYLLELLKKINPDTAAYFEITERLKDFEAVIATGSNNSARYFEAYFGTYPHIIRKNRNAVAVLDGQETKDELHLLGKDIFRFFGLGCRNVSKLYLSENYDFQLLLETLHDYREIVLHDKYKNNYDYNLALAMLNRIAYYNNGSIILTENPAIPSRIAMLHYSYYSELDKLETELSARAEEIQCTVARAGLLKMPVVAFGQTQSPALDDYPDGVDVMEFLCKL